MSYKPIGSMQAEVGGGPARHGRMTNGHANGHNYVNGSGHIVPVHDAATMHAHQGAPGGAMPDENIGGLVGPFSGLNLQGGHAGQNGTGMPNVPHTQGAFMGTVDGNIMFAPAFHAPIHPMHAMGPADHVFGATPYPLPYPGHFSAGYTAPYGLNPGVTPGRAVTYGERVPREIPGLENRRGSYSTSATESAPATPFFGIGGSTARIASNDRSSFTTPSPREGAYGQYSPKSVIIDPELERLLVADPAIPRAVPAVWTDHVKPLEQCLENRIQGNRNVYIRGLHPTTDDRVLLDYTERFGDVEQSKAIIDTQTGACKGFGFAKFKDVKDSEKCIRGFYRLGYEVGFARESFNARLKAEGDDNSTNLYISNLPKDMNETVLAAVFDGFTIVSSKILRDSMGNSRGVGFARFETRDVCEQVIRNFHGVPVGPDRNVMQVRYADTPAQKELKRITAERRQYRTNEYNIGAYGTHHVGMNPSIYNSGTWGGGRRAATGPAGPRSSSMPPNGTAGPIPRVMGRGGGVPDTTASATASSDDGSGDEGVTIVDSPIVANGSTQSSPSAKEATC